MPLLPLQLENVERSRAKLSQLLRAQTFIPDLISDCLKLSWYPQLSMQIELDIRWMS